MKVLRTAVAFAYDSMYNTSDTSTTIFQLIKNDFDELEIIIEPRKDICIFNRPKINDEFAKLYFDEVKTVKDLKPKHYSTIIDIFVENSDKYIELFDTYE